MNRAEWMNECLIWSRGRLISPSLPVGDDRYLNLNSQKRPTGRNLGGNVWYDALAHVQRYCCLGILPAHAQCGNDPLTTVIHFYIACIYLSCIIIHQIFSLARDWSKRVPWGNIPQKTKTGEYPWIYITPKPH